MHGAPPSRAGPSLGLDAARRGQRNASTMAATIKPSVASQLTAPINSSVMRQWSPLLSATAPDTRVEQKGPVSKKDPAVASEGSSSEFSRRRVKEAQRRIGRRGWGRLIQKGGGTSLGIEDAHLTAQYIDELWQGIHTRILEHLPNLGRFTSPGWDRVFRIMDQGPETQHLEPTAPGSNTSPLHEDGACAFGPNRERDEQHQRRGDRQHYRGDHEIHDTPHLILRVALISAPEELLFSKIAHDGSIAPRCVGSISHR